MKKKRYQWSWWQVDWYEIHKSYYSAPYTVQIFILLIVEPFSTCEIFLGVYTCILSWDGMVMHTTLAPTVTYLRVEVESLQGVDDLRILCDIVIHDGLQALAHGWWRYDGLVVGII